MKGEAVAKGEAEGGRGDSAMQVPSFLVRSPQEAAAAAVEGAAVAESVAGIRQGCPCMMRSRDILY